MLFKLHNVIYYVMFSLLRAP